MHGAFRSVQTENSGYEDDDDDVGFGDGDVDDDDGYDDEMRQSPDKFHVVT